MTQRKSLETAITEDNKMLCEMLSESLTRISSKYNVYINCKVTDGGVKVFPRFSIIDKKDRAVLTTTTELSYPHIHTWIRTESIYKEKVRHIEKDIRRLMLVLNHNKHVNVLKAGGSVLVSIETRNRYF